MSSQRQPEAAIDTVRQADILLVEDDQRLAELTAAYLRQNGFSVSIEHRGDRVFDHFQRLQVKLVILDVLRPCGAKATCWHPMFAETTRL